MTPISFILVYNMHRLTVGLKEEPMVRSEEAIERKNEILHVAERLFNQKGYDATSTNDILNEIGIARGTLYYHFKNKEAIMDGVITRYIQRIISRVQSVCDQKEIHATERLLLAIGALNISEDVSDDVMTHIHQPQNALMHQKIEAALFQKVTPLLAMIIQDGVEGGVFETDYPYESVEMLFMYAVFIFDEGNNKLSKKEQLTRKNAFSYNVERILG